jgi:CubicO group peptidase (beta-lactamase class C family)
MTAERLMLWLSSSKPIGAVALAQLWEAGKLELDDTVATHIPEFGVKGKEAITIRHLLTHTGGFRLLRVGWPKEPWERIIERICDSRIEPRWHPGRTAGYHLSSSWFILGELVRRLDGRRFEVYVREQIFEPLGMDDSWIGMPDELYDEYAPRLAPMFNTELSPVERHDWHERLPVTRCSPGGSGWGPMNQLARFYQALVGGGRIGDVRILRSQTIEAMVARHRVGLDDRTFRAKIDWGLGFVLNSDHYGQASVPYAYGRHSSPRTFGHSGYRSSAAFADPEHRLVVALAVNGTPAEDVHRRRFEAILSAIYYDLELVEAG